MAINKNKVMEGALKLVEKGAYDKAIKEYLRVVQEDPKDVRVWLKIGDLHAKKNAKQEATDTYLKVATLYTEQGFYLKAVAVYKQILKIDPRLVDVNLKLAALYKQLQLPTEAMAQFEQVATFCHREGKPKEAVLALQQIIEIDPNNVATRIKLAELFSKEGQSKEAIEEFTRVTAQLKAQGRVEDFIKVAERLVWHQPDNRALNRELAELYIKRGDPRRALQKLQACFKADPRDVETLALLAGAFEDLGQTAKTTSVLKELARIHQENGANDKRMEVLRRIQSLSPDDTEVRAALGAARPPGPGTGQRPSVPNMPQVTFTGPSAGPPPPNMPTTRMGMTGAMPIVNIDDPQYSPSRVATPIEGVPSDRSRAPAGTGGHSSLVPGTNTRRDAPREPEFDELAVDEDVAFAEPSRQADVFEEEASAVRDAAADDFTEEVAKILAESDVYVKYGLHQKALDHVKPIVTRDPRNLEAHEKLKEIYLKLGRYDEAAVELTALVEITGSARSEVAATFLGELAAISPGDSRARALADRFGLILPDPEPVPMDARGSEPAPLEPPREITKSNTQKRVDPLGYGDEFSDEIIVAESLDDEDHGLIVEAPPLDMDSERFVPVRGNTVRAVTIPDAEPLGENTLDQDPDDVIAEVEARQETLDDLDMPTLDPVSPDAPAPVAAPVEDEGGSSLEDDLDEADFFVQQNLYGEARSILEDLLTRYPNHPLVAAKLADVDALAAAEAGGVAVEVEPQTPAAEPAPPAAEVYQLTQQRHVHAKVSDEDVETHYDLGIAYKEMGLHADAIKEFQVVMQLPGRAVQCSMMIGLCHTEMNQHTEAINQFKSALYEPQITEREALALYFELGQAYERLSDSSEALYYYEKVAKRDARFREVGKRIAALRERLTAEEQKPRKRDENDRLLDR